MNLLGTHDTVRILTVLGGRSLDGLTYAEMRDVRMTATERSLALARLRLAYAILYFMPGIPCIYYGDEAGMEGAKDPFNRRTYPWGREDGELLAFFRALGKFREVGKDVLAHGYFRPVLAKGGFLVLERFLDERRLLLLVNRGTDSAVFSPGGSFRDLLTDETESGDITVCPLGFKILMQI